MTRFLLPPLLAALALPALAQHSLEIIALRHRTVEQVLPVLRPLLEPGGTLTGQRGQLIVRTSPSNLAELRQALAAIDQPARRLQISVRFDDVGASQRTDVAAGARIDSRGSRVEIRGSQDEARLAERVDQRVQVLEGGRAIITLGRSTPLAAGIWETATGFEAIPRLAGDRVFLDIAPHKESFDRQQRVATTVSARLGEWFEVAGAASNARRDERGVLSRNRSDSVDSARVWLKVEELP